VTTRAVGIALRLKPRSGVVKWLLPDQDKGEKAIRPTFKGSELAEKKHAKIKMDDTCRQSKQFIYESKACQRQAIRSQLCMYSHR